eukprot:scaffold114034_cov63-Phaeocystis_antarctica.AAC.1
MLGAVRRRVAALLSVLLKLQGLAQDGVVRLLHAHELRRRLRAARVDVRVVPARCAHEQALVSASVRRKRGIVGAAGGAVGAAHRACGRPRVSRQTSPSASALAWQDPTYDSGDGANPQKAEISHGALYQPGELDAHVGRTRQSDGKARAAARAAAAR